MSARSLLRLSLSKEKRLQDRGAPLFIKKKKKRPKRRKRKESFISSQRCYSFTYAILRRRNHGAGSEGIRRRQEDEMVEMGLMYHSLFCLVTQSLKSLRFH